MAKRKRGCLTSIFSFLLVTVLVLGIALVVVVNLTPRQLGVANKQVTESYTVEQLGAADTKLWPIIKLLKALVAQPQLDKVTPNAYTSADSISADSKFALTSIGLSEGTPNYKSLLYLPLVATTPVTIKSSELAYMVDKALHQFYASPEGAIASDVLDIVQLLMRIDASVTEITFAKKGDDILLTTGIKVNISQYTADINAKLGKYKLNDEVYCSFASTVNVVDQTIVILPVKGVLEQKDFVSVSVNGQPDSISRTAVDVLMKMSAENPEDAVTAQQIGGYICTLLSQFFKDIGEIGVGSSALDFVAGPAGINCGDGFVTFKPRI